MDERLVRDLLRDQYPDVAGGAVHRVGSGWDNVTFRVGEELAVRLPRTAAAGALLLKEQRWLPRVAAALPVPTPVPLRTGAPGGGFPWPWSVVPWIAGTTADQAPPDPSQAPLLARFLAALHRPGPPDAPRNPWRGVPLASRDHRVRAAVTRVTADRPPHWRRILTRVWEDAARAPLHQGAVWLHGDLHPRNVVTRDGRLRGVIDWGDMCVGDPATDLAAAWMLLPAQARDVFWRAYGPVPHGTVLRAAGWAVSFATLLVEDGSVHDASFARVGHTTLERIIEEHSQ